MASVETNWAGNHTYTGRVERPGSIEQLQDAVAREPRVRPLGSRHSFTDLTDSDGVLVSLDGLPTSVEVDPESRTATVRGRALYGDVARALERHGWAVANLASLPHISVAGAVATGTHGSGDANGSLATAVCGLEVVGPDGTIRTLTSGDADLPGSVVALGALGVVSGLTLRLEPTFTVRQDVYTGLTWKRLATDLEAVTADAYSVSLFTRWDDAGIYQAWRKSREDAAPDTFFGAPRAEATVHMLEGGPTESVTRQQGEAGPWLDRLPHFRMEFTPSRGEELQSEYLVPRTAAREAIEGLRALGARMAPVLQTCELRTVAADDLWLSGSYGRDVLAVHFTWVRDVPAVHAVLPALEELLLPLGGRPHWGKCFVATAAVLEPLYPRMADFRALRDRVDPDRVFGNAFLERVIGD
jgi:xylitol oxidase